MNALSTPEPITHAAALADALDGLADSAFVALDTEFMREKTYYPKLCLVQIAAPGRSVLIDPLAIDDLKPLWSFLRERTRPKAVHAARQDIEVLLAAERGDAAVPGPLFDTQLAAAFLGASTQVGYGELVAARLGQPLEKGHARTDWLKRPLSAEQLRYAADDVIYLVPLYENLRSALLECGRLTWLEEECARLEDPDLYRTHPERAWQRLKGVDRLRPHQRSVLKALAQWREEAAMKHNKPRGWILADETVRALSERLPQSLDSLQGIPLLAPGTLRKSGAELLALVADAATREDVDTIEWQRPDQRQLSRVSSLMAFVRAEALRLQIGPELLATRRDIEQLVFRERTDRFERGWRAEAIGAALLQKNQELRGS
ncbi:MAG: ribonuclease D [Steroidobacteraceae bacterium]